MPDATKRAILSGAPEPPVVGRPGVVVTPVVGFVEIDVAIEVPLHGAPVLVL
jgi:hypothetical protein